MPFFRSEAPKEETAETYCRGGLSWGCRHDPHLQKGKIGKRKIEAKDIFCYRCETRLGCTLCVEPSREILCLYCHNWGHKRGVEHHGDIVPNHKVPNVFTDKGWKHFGAQADHEVDKLLTALVDDKSVKRQTEVVEDAELVPKTPEELAKELQRRRELSEQAKRLKVGS